MTIIRFRQGKGTLFKKENKMIKLDFLKFKALSHGMSTDQARYYLNGIHVIAKDNTLIMEATNGHALMRITDAQGYMPDVNEIISADTVKMVLKLFFKTSRIYADFDRKILDVDGLEYPMVLIDGTFPDIDRVIPDNREDKIPNGFGFDLGYLEDFSKSLRAFGKTKAFAKLVFGDDKSCPLRIEAEHEGMDYLGALMPTKT